MKKLILLLSVIACSVALAQTAFVREALFKVRPNANINASTIRITSGELALNRTATFSVELYSAQGRIVDRQTITLKRADLRQWMASGEPTAFLKGLVLSNLSTAVESESGDAPIE